MSGMIVAKEKLWRTAGTRDAHGQVSQGPFLVEDGDPRAAFLYSVPGRKVISDEFDRLIRVGPDDELGDVEVDDSGFAVSKTEKPESKPTLVVDPGPLEADDSPGPDATVKAPRVKDMKAALGDAGIKYPRKANQYALAGLVAANGVDVRFGYADA